MSICPPTLSRTAQPHDAQNSRSSRPRQWPRSGPVVVMSASAKLARCAALGVSALILVSWGWLPLPIWCPHEPWVPWGHGGEAPWPCNC